MNDLWLKTSNVGNGFSNNLHEIETCMIKKMVGNGLFFMRKTQKIKSINFDQDSDCLSEVQYCISLLKNVYVKFVVYDVII